MGHATRRSALLVYETECYADYGLAEPRQQARDTRLSTRETAEDGPTTIVIGTVRFPIVADVMGTAQAWAPGTQTSTGTLRLSTARHGASMPSPGPTAAEPSHAPLDQGPTDFMSNEGRRHISEPESGREASCLPAMPRAES